MVIVYNLRRPGAWQAAHRHRAFWGKLYTDIHALDDHRVALVFRPAPDERWASWEARRRQRILGPDLGDEAA